jgi:hypothetical protein
VPQKLTKNKKRSVGRPKKLSHELKSEFVRERVTREDKAKIENYLAKKSLSITAILKKYIDDNP